MKRHNILYLCLSPLVGGAELSLIGLLNNLDRNMFRPIVVVPTSQVGTIKKTENRKSSKGLTERLKDIGVETLSIPCAKFNPWNPLPYIMTVLRLMRLAKAQKIDLIHSNEFLPNQYGVVVSKLCRIPIICHVRLILGHRAIRNTFLKYSDFLIANSKVVAGNLLDIGIERSKISVIYNGVDTERYKFDDSRRKMFRRRWRIDDDAVLLGVIGRIDRTKGQDVAIKTLRSLKEYNVQLIIAGDTAVDGSQDYLFELKRLVSDLGLEDRVVFLGFLEDARDFYMGIDILLVPSINEPFGRVLIEAMAAGRIVVASDSGGPREIVAHRQSGLLFPYHNVTILADLICELAKNRDFSEYLGNEAIKRVRTNFDIIKHTKDIENVYQKLLVRR